MFTIRSMNSVLTNDSISGAGQQTLNGGLINGNSCERRIVVKNKTLLQKELTNDYYSALGGGIRNTSEKINFNKNNILFPSVRSRMLSFQGGEPQCLSNQEIEQPSNSILDELSLIKSRVSFHQNNSSTNGSELSGGSGIIFQQDKRGLMAFLGQDNVGEQALNILGQQIPRIFKNKEPYDILFMNKNVKSDYQKNAKKYIIDELHDVDLKNKNVKLAIAAAIKTSYKNNKLLTPSECDVNSYKKVYILGHGSAGDAHITCGNEYLGPRDIVSRMENMGLLALKDIRLLPCYSADVQKTASVYPFHGGVDRKQKSLLEHMATELTNRRYKDIKLTAYNGAGVFISPDKKTPFTHLRAIQHECGELFLPRSKRRVSIKIG
ncbi:TPA: hypothetical protein ACHKU1_005099 [Escherichia coli]|nr:hypothetical protein [Escherichia coli]HEI4000122.1 hypothetical protein [Escherichia coli]